MSISQTISVFVIAAASVSAQPKTADERLADALPANRFELKFDSAGHFSGPGAAVIGPALAEARFVMIGEQHGTAEVPQFVSAVCAILGPAGFHTMAVEAGPYAAEVLFRALATPNAAGEKSIGAFMARYPLGLAFYDWRDEFEMLRRCSQSSPQKPFRLWGLDQEFLGSAGPLLEAILDAKPSAEAAMHVRDLIAQNQTATAKATATGNPADLFLFQASDADLTRLREMLTGRARTLLDELIKSRHIYLENATSGWDSNRHRSQLMKDNFRGELRDATAAGESPTKVLFKFGDFHAYKGFNPLHNNDLGNLVAELADADGAQSVHIMVRCLTGEELEFSGVGKKPNAAHFEWNQDRHDAWLKPLIDQRIDGAWTVYDLRAIRKAVGARSHSSRELERLVLGYDFFVLAPRGTASSVIELQ